jgi:tetratricopeptide (TPR) repeat protein
MLGKRGFRVAVLVLTGYCAAASAATVPVEIYVAGPRADPGMCAVVSTALREVSVDFQVQFGFGFTPLPCLPADEIEAGSKVDRGVLARFARRGGRGGIVLLAVARPGQRYGLSDFRRGATAVSLALAGRGGPHPRVILEHEIGHLFGAVHVGDRESPMFPSAGTGQFDASSRRLIGLLRGRRFLDEPIPVSTAVWRAYAEALASTDDRRLRPSERDRSTMLVVALRGLGRDGEATIELERARARGESTPELDLADVREEIRAGGFERIARSFSTLSRLSEANVEVEPEREAAIDELVRLGEDARVSGDSSSLEASIALLDSLEPREAALLRASELLGRGETAEARAWLELAEPSRHAEYFDELRCAEAVESSDADRASCVCGSASSLSSAVLKKWADLAFEEGDYADAAFAWGRAIRREPRDALARQSRALALFRAGDRDGARREIEAARSLGLEIGRDLEDEIGGR